MSAARTPIDITQPIADGMPTWPGDPPVLLERVTRFADGEDFEVSRLATSVHVGTHVDAPAHVVPGGAGVESLSLTTLIGPAVVVDVSASAQVDVAALEATVPPGATRVLLRTRNQAAPRDVQSDNPTDSRPEPKDQPRDEDADREPEMPAFRTDFAALLSEAAEWLVARGVILVGIDSPSIAPWTDLETPHRILLGAGVVVVEGLRLSHVRPGRYDLICLPLPLVGGDGAPARVVLLPEA